MRTERERVFAREEYALPPDGVHVWRGRTNWPAAEIDDLKLILSSDEQQRAAKFHFDADRRRFLVGRGMLRVLIGRCLGMPANRLTIACAAAGKPKVAAGKGPTLEFNISHSGEVVLIAIARVRPVGIDVERMRTDIEIDHREPFLFTKGAC